MKKGGKGGWAAAVHGLYFDEEGEREREREFLESLRHVLSVFALSGFVGR